MSPPPSIFHPAHTAHKENTATHASCIYNVNIRPLTSIPPPHAHTHTQSLSLSRSWVNFVAAAPQWTGVPTVNNSGSILFSTVVPTSEDYALLQAVGLLGAVIMPHNIYLHSALVQSRTIDRSNKKAVGEACKYNSIDSTISLVLSFFINLAVVAVFAKGFFNKEDCARPGWDMYTYPYKSKSPLTTGKQSNTNLGCLAVNVSDVARVTANASAFVPTLDGCHRFTAGQPSVTANAFMHCQTPGGGAGLCCEIGLSNAAVALRGVLGEAAPIVWGVGLLAAGQASTMTGTFAGQFVMEGFMKWKVRKGQVLYSYITLHSVCSDVYLLLFS